MAAQDYQQLTNGNDGGANLGQSSADKVALYGAVPVVQRTYSSAIHATANLTTANTSLQSALLEVQKTLIGLGIYPTS
jgi:hypothetical protein